MINHLASTFFKLLIVKLNKNKAKMMLNLQKIADELDFDLEDVELLMESFFKNIDKLMLPLKDAIDKNEFEQIFKSAHAIKGSAGNLTLMNISNMAKDIELAAMKNERIDYNAMFDKLENLIKDISIL